MAISYGTIETVSTVQSDAAIPGDLQIARVTFSIPTSYTYAQANDLTISAVGAAISASRKNGKTVTLRDVMLAQPAALTASPYTVHTLKTLAVSTDDITAELCVADYSTEYANATAVAAMSTPFAIFVAFTEA